MREIGHPSGEAVELKRLVDLAASVDLKQERDQMWQRARQSRKDGQFASAVQFGERMLAIDQIRLGDGHSTVTLGLQWLASVYGAAGKWSLAIE